MSYLVYPQLPDGDVLSQPPIDLLVVDWQSIYRLPLTGLVLTG